MRRAGWGTANRVMAVPGCASPTRGLSLNADVAASRGLRRATSDRLLLQRRALFARDHMRFAQRVAAGVEER